MLPRITILCVVLIVCINVLVFKSWFTERLKEFIDWVQDNPISGPFTLCAAMIAIVIILIPYSLLAIGTGYALSKTYN